MDQVNDRLLFIVAIADPVRHRAALMGLVAVVTWRGAFRLLWMVGKINDNKSEPYGFDAETEQYVDMLSAGIVDPAKVVRVALQDAASNAVHD
jgi:chaperonin GroEL (HSP60 family)